MHRPCADRGLYITGFSRTYTYLSASQVQIFYFHRASVYTCGNPNDLLFEPRFLILRVLHDFCKILVSARGNMHTWNSFYGYNLYTHALRIAITNFQK